ncbi:hypothetical protein V2S66_07210 [Streptomyces sp. V4-01]|uniref:DNA-directed RNA polymerase specialized sigma24 family protein n=1 Tax=Actinacidiphila polyblastidii TaxID=3110430 RepID=A0ABU7P7H0_9ACTN|nr:hypothetical protein [Streptomyces sp. V4-01]
MSGRKRHAAAKRDSRPRKAQRAAPAAETSTARPPGRAARPAGTPAAAPAAPEHVLPRTDRPAAPEATTGAATEATAAPTVPVTPDAPATPHPSGAPGTPEAAEAREVPAAPAPPRWTAEDAFDALYVRTAAALLRQTTVLTGDPAAAHRAVAHAFDLAWQQWPDVARDTDPAGWVRAAAHEYALAPWQRWLPHRGSGPRQQPAPAERSEAERSEAERSEEVSAGAEQVGVELSGEVLAAVAAALRGLDPARRRAVLLFDGVGLDLAAAAVESEASTGAMAGRIVRGREELAAAVPGLPGLPGVAMALGALLDAGGEAAELPQEPKRVRDASERGVRRRTVGAYALTGLIAVLTLVVVLVGPGTGAHASGPDAGPGAGPGTRSGGASGDAAGRPPFGEPARDLLP